MGWYVYNKETTIILRKHWYDDAYATERAAKAALTRAVNKGEVKREDYAIADSADFHAKIEKMETKVNLLSGKEFQQPVNTPMCCDPSTETYHSM